MRKILKTICLILFCISGYFIIQGFDEDSSLARAKSTLQNIFTLYNAGHDNLLFETYPFKPGDKVTYLAGSDTMNGKRVAYLWPTSGVFSGVNAMFRTTGDKRYLKILEKKVLPGLDQYFDSSRKPECFQSYVTSAGKSDRYYDDNIWLGLDFCDLYSMTGNSKYLEKSIGLWNFVMSGWDDQLGGGIYWCEQKRQSKNTCSNAPAAVLALKLYEATKDTSYLNHGLRIYHWTKKHLQDTTDFLYFDNENLSGKISRRKYTYNSGQMLQASSLIYRLTGRKQYLEEAQQIAQSAINYFTEEFVTPEGKNIRLFKNTGNWFNAILLRGYAELYNLDNNARYAIIFKDNMDQLWRHVRDKNGLFSKDWKGLKDDEYKWLLDQASLVEIWATLEKMKL